jgi:hypothetical protein
MERRTWQPPNNALPRPRAARPLAPRPWTGRADLRAQQGKPLRAVQGGSNCAAVCCLGLVLLALLTASGAPSSASPEGSWAGVLQQAELRLRLGVNITRDATGQLAGTLDSVDQGARGIPLDGVHFERGTLQFELKQLGCRYEGTLDAAGNTLSGKWLQAGHSFPLVLARMPTNPPPDSAEPLTPEQLAASREAARRVSGLWQARVVQDGTTNLLRLKLWRAANGAARAAFDSSLHSAVNLPVTDIGWQDGRLAFTVPGLGASFSGTVGTAPDRLTGAWRQSDASVPVEFTKVPPMRP